MAFTVIAFSESKDEAGVSTKINAVQDQTHKTSTTKIYVSTLNKLLGAVAFAGSTGTEARLTSPSLRATNPYYLAPINTRLYGGQKKTFNANADGSYTQSADSLIIPTVARIDPSNPLALITNESLEGEITADPSSAEQHTIIVYVADEKPTEIQGNFYTINANFTSAITAGEWVFSEMTLPDELPIGDYSVVGARVVCSQAVAFRFVNVGDVYRAGGLCVSDPSASDIPLQRYGKMGKWFDFNSVLIPGIEILSSATVSSATYEVYIDIITK